MMKTTNTRVCSGIAAAMFALFSTGALADVSISGKMEGGFSWKKNTDGTRVSGIDSFESEIDFAGKEDLGNGLKAIWQMNNNVHIDGSQAGDTLASGDTFLGLSGGFGAVKLGHGINAYGDGYWKAGFYSLGDHGPDKGVGGVLGMGDAGGQKGAIKYETPKFGHFNAAASWAAGEKAGSSNKGGNAWAVGVNWEEAIFGMHAGYTEQYLVNGTSGAYSDAGRAKDWVLAAKVTPLNGLALGAEYNHSTLSPTAATIGSFTVPSDRAAQKSLALYGEYKPDRFAVRASATHTSNYRYASDNKRNEYVLGVSYDLSKRTALLAEYLRSKVGSDARASNQLIAGIHVGF
jgi:predicted porin